MIKKLDYYKPRKVEGDQWRNDIYEKINEIISVLNRSYMKI